MIDSAVVTIGVFDGLHRGHQAVIRRAEQRAQEAASRCVVLTFGTHPRMILNQKGAPPLLTTVEEKAALLKEFGAQEVRVLQFNQELARTGPREFLRKHVFPFYRLSRLVIGYDFAMGRDRAGTAPVLGAYGARCGFLVEQVGPTQSGGRPASSTRIRAALIEGRPDQASELLGRPYRLSGPVVTGEGRGRAIGAPTANIHLSRQKLLPANGVYVVRVSGAGLENALAVANLGVRPTVGSTSISLEVHVLDFQGDLVGQFLHIDFIQFLREEFKFNSINELSDAIRADIQAAKDS